MNHVTASPSQQVLLSKGLYFRFTQLNTWCQRLLVVVIFGIISKVCLRASTASTTTDEWRQLQVYFLHKCAVSTGIYTDTMWPQCERRKIRLGIRSKPKWKKKGNKCISIDCSACETVSTSLYFEDDRKHECIEVFSVAVKIFSSWLCLYPGQVMTKWSSHYSTCLSFVDKFQHLYHSSKYFCPCDVVVDQNSPVLEFPRKWLRSGCEPCWAGGSEHSGSAGNVSHPFAPPQPSCSLGQLFLVSSWG